MRAALICTALALLPCASWGQGPWGPHEARPMGDYAKAFDAEWDAQARRFIYVLVSSGDPRYQAFTILGLTTVNQQSAVFRSSSHPLPGAKSLGEQIVRRDWASASNCPALQGRLEALMTIEVPRPFGPRGDPRAPPRAYGGPLYTLDARAVPYANGDNGNLKVQGYERSPIGVWMEETNKALAGCWKPGWPP
jgi:hypothetical protein